MNTICDAWNYIVTKLCTVCAVYDTRHAMWFSRQCVRGCVCLFTKYQTILELINFIFDVSLLFDAFSFEKKPAQFSSISSKGQGMVVVVVVSQFNGTSTPKGSCSAKTGDNDCNVNSSRYRLRTALCESIRYQAKSEQNVRKDLIPRVRHGEAALMHPKGQGIHVYSYWYTIIWDHVWGVPTAPSDSTLRDRESSVSVTHI